MKKFMILLFVIVLSVSCIIVLPSGSIHYVDTLLDDQFIVSLAFENDGTAWAGIIRDQYGLVKINPDGSTEIFDHTNSCLKDSMNIYDIEIDNEGNIWMLNGGLVCYDGSSFTRYDTISENQFPKSFPNLLTIDNDNKVWFTANNPFINCPNLTIYSFDGTDFTSYEPDGISAEMLASISDIEMDRQGNIWFALGYFHSDPVFLKYSGSEWTFYDTSDIGFVPYRITAMEFDSDNMMWFNDDISLSSMHYDGHPGLYCFDGENEAVGFGDNLLISEIGIDNADNVWFAGLSPRLGILDINHKWAIDDSDDVGFCRVMEMGPNGDMWLGTSTGIMIYRYSETK
jgi:ligand-binding sensor domain-containing protein